MKKIITLAMALMLGVMFMSSCSKKSDSPSYTMNAKVGSTAFSSSNTYAILAGTALSISGSSGSGTTATAPYLSITIQNFTGTGTYNMDSTFTSPASATWAPTSNVLDAKGTKSGSVVIKTSSSTSVSGTFSCTLTDGTTVSGGTFTAKRF